MASTEFQLKLTYQNIGAHHLLVHLFGCKVNEWMLLDLAGISRKTGKTYAEIIQGLLS